MTDRDTKVLWEAIGDASRKPTGYLYTRYANRNMARPLTLAFAKLGVRPVAVTLLSILLTVGGAVLHLAQSDRPGVGAVVVVYGLLMLGYALDSSDGQLARVSNQATQAGGFLDHTVDGAKLALVGIAVSWPYLEMQIADGQPSLIAGWPMLVLTGAAVLHFTATWQLASMEAGEARRLTPRKPFSPGWWLASLFDYGVFMMLAPLSLWHAGYVTIMPVYAVAYAVFAMLMVRKHFVRLAS